MYLSFSCSSCNCRWKWPQDCPVNESFHVIRHSIHFVYSHLIRKTGRKMLRSENCCDVSQPVGLVVRNGGPWWFRNRQHDEDWVKWCMTSEEDLVGLCQECDGKFWIVSRGSCRNTQHRNKMDHEKCKQLANPGLLAKNIAVKRCACVRWMRVFYVHNIL